ncbi:MAG: putative acetyltransferase [Eubacterium sp.]|nr:putative acetyltransferase [Eubacterium sp.]
MKTLIFNGSPRKDGDTVSLLNELLKHIKGEYKIIDTYYSNIKPCIDCRYCWEEDGCCQEDEWKEVDTYIRECENIVIASPIYFSELTGQLLSSVSKIQAYWSARFFRKKEIISKPKKGGIILIGGGDGHMSTPIDTATDILYHMNAHNVAPAVCSHDTNNK